MILEQRPEEAPPCPWSGIDGGPQHSAHIQERVIADRVSAAIPEVDGTSAEYQFDPVMDKIAVAAGEQPGMRLYEVSAWPISRAEPGISFHAAYFRCLVCGFVLPAQRSR